MDVGQWVIVGLSVFLGAWYIAASSFNRRRGVATYHWLRAGLESLGKVTEASWIGSSGSGARLVVGQASHPFRRIEVVFLLESREILPLWLFNRLRGKQDELILKATLRKVPSREFEVARVTDRSFGDPPNKGLPVTLKPVPGPEGFQVAASRAARSDHPTELDDFLTAHPTAILSASLRRTQPHLILRAYLPDLLEKGTGEAFFNNLRVWITGKDAGSRPD